MLILYSIMKKLFFVLTFFTFFVQSAWAIDCGDLIVAPAINITTSYGKLKYDNTKTTDEVTAMAKKFNLVESDLFASGLATATLNFDISIIASASPINIGEFCVIPSQVKIFLGFSQPVIYLANSLEKDSCRYNIVLRHEQTHQQINKTALEYYLPIFKAAATKIVQNAQPIKITDTKELEQATKTLTEQYNQKLNPLVDFIKKEIAGEQKKLDNPANYKYENVLSRE